MSADYDLIASTNKSGKVLAPLEAIATHSEKQLDTGPHPRFLVAPLLLQLDKFSAVIDMVVQFLPQVTGVSILLLAWDSIKFKITVSPLDVCLRLEDLLVLTLMGLCISKRSRRTC